MEEVELVVIGAGWAGIAAAKTFHQLNPAKSLVILDSNASVGGTWASERLYPGLKTNNQLGTYEFPDFPMSTEDFGVKPKEHIPGRVVHEYLKKVTEAFNIADKIRYSTRVISAEHKDSGGWVVTAVKVEDGVSGIETRYFANKLVVASGLTSEPFLPQFDGGDLFGRPVFHGKDFAKYADTIDTAKKVTIFGGTKSGWDAVYAYATKGVHVDWVIRASGHGPSWMSPPFVTPLKKWLEKLVMTRMLTWFSPCSWGDADGYTHIRSFLHGTAVGRFITNTFWSILGNDVITLNDYKSHPETAKIQPWSQPMFVASSFSILNYDTDFFDLLRNGTVKVHIADITGLGPGTVKLSDGTEIATDAMCCVTGWKWTPPLIFLPEGIEAELGVPHPPSPSDPTDLVAKADKEILARWPRLRSPPVQNRDYVPLTEQTGITTLSEEDRKASPHTSSQLTPWSLYRFVIPSSPSLIRHRDVAFAGMMMNFNIPLNAHMQSLWINAYFYDRGLTLPNYEDDLERNRMRYETILHSRFGKWRYPAGHGSQFPDFVFDAQPYIDLLARDLGVQVHRKGGFLKEMSEPYGPKDYVDVVQEWKQKHQINEQ
ncbi:hypothetical protein N0V93_000998 [Gnomoniopsis smithogilvyi]|uniref:Uncharacterized protein n=1 Tax=Gnomoniopsis smithogilvyi TaxID=1191159 RepID=A0A9W8Z0T7_9PEZI|nr:hypothetical protein N0V93_000998 [Gnomoniopsis smithogilvyi]